MYRYLFILMFSLFIVANFAGETAVNTSEAQPSISKTQVQIRESTITSANGELTRVDPDSYEPDGGTNEFTELNVAWGWQWQHHTLHSTTDQDWYRFYGAVGMSYYFYSTGSTDTDIYLYNNNGTVQYAYDFDSGEGTNFDLVFTPSVSAWYKIQVDGYNGAGNGVGAYDFVYLFQDSFEPDNDASTYTTIFPPGFQTHSFHTHVDQDWYRFYAYSGIDYHFYSTSADSDPRIYLYQDDGSSLIAEDNDSGEDDNFDLVFNPTVSAWYKIMIKSGCGRTGLYDFYYNYAEDSYEPDDDPNLFTFLTVSNLNQTQNHSLHSETDQDWFRFYAYPGATYTFYSTGTTDTQIYLYEDNGTTLLAWADDVLPDLNFHLEFTPPVYELYKVKVVGYNGASGYYGFNYSYNAYPDAYEPDDTAAQFRAITMTVNNQTQNHTIHSASDEDWFRFYGYAGRLYNFYSTGGTDTRIFLYADNGTTLLGFDNDDGDSMNYSLQFAPTSNGYYRVKVDGMDDWVGGYVFNYFYSADPDAFEPDNSTTEYTAISPTQTLQIQNHTLHSNTDQDWFRFQGVANMVYTFYAIGNLDDRVWLYQDDGTTLLANDDDSGDGFNFLLNFVPTTTAYYKLKVDGYAGMIGSYAFHYVYSPDFATPTNVNISVVNNTLSIQWDAVIGATGYRIEASDDPTTGFSLVGNPFQGAFWSTSVSAARKFYRVIALY